MSLTSGFFNSRNGDRTYNAEDMSKLFAGIIPDGVFLNYPFEGDCLKVSKTEALTVKVGPGRAWFKNIWIDNNSDYVLPTLSSPDQNNDRIDVVFIKVDKSNSVRSCSFYVKTGVAAISPRVPTMTNTAEVFYYELARIRIKSGNSTGDIGTIENRVGVSGGTNAITTPFTPVNASSVLELWHSEVLNEVQNTIQLYLGNDASPLYQMITGEPAIWLCNEDLPTSINSVVIAPEDLNPDYSSNYSSGIEPLYHVKANDIVIGKNGYYGIVQSYVLIRGSNDVITGAQITVQTFGKRIVPDISVIPSIWLYDGTVSSVYNDPTITVYPSSLYPDTSGSYSFGIEPVYHAKKGDIIIGNNGYYGVVVSYVPLYNDNDPTAIDGAQILVNPTGKQIALDTDFLVRFWHDNRDDVSDKTFLQIHTARQAGKKIRFEYESTSNGSTKVLAGTTYKYVSDQNEEYYEFIFNDITPSLSGINAFSWQCFVGRISSDGIVQIGYNTHGLGGA